MDTEISFKYHNIDLGNGEMTILNQPLHKDIESISEVLRYIKKAYNHYPIKKRSFLNAIDLGSLEGAYTVEMENMNYRVTSLEARKENIKKLEWLKEKIKGRFNIIQDDVKNLKNHGEFDLILCSGLLYHLDNPVDFIKIMSECTKNFLIINTHFAREHDGIYDVLPFLNNIKRAIYKRIPKLFNKRNFGLSALKINEGYKGRWFKEYQLDDTKENIENSLLAAYSNQKSFWLTESAVIDNLTNNGFEVKVIQKDNYNDTISLICSKFGMNDFNRQ